MNKPVTRAEMKVFHEQGMSGDVVGGKELIGRTPEGQPIYQPNRFERSRKKLPGNNRKTGRSRTKITLYNVLKDDHNNEISRSIKTEFTKSI
jgi:hypothetical protein